ncbi:hypothetical protein F5146DRAFT_1116761 [Armillaria mellea]|nr:hypothetical protein F5146DRAFT_1116761 [Armillaria mellea]
MWRWSTICTDEKVLEIQRMPQSSLNKIRTLRCNKSVMYLAVAPSQLGDILVVGARRDADAKIKFGIRSGRLDSEQLAESLPKISEFVFSSFPRTHVEDVLNEMVVMKYITAQHRGPHTNDRAEKDSLGAMLSAARHMWSQGDEASGGLSDIVCARKGLRVVPREASRVRDVADVWLVGNQSKIPSGSNNSASGLQLYRDVRLS